MNIFVLDREPVAAARAHCDKHVVKMTLETGQLLSTVAGRGYKPTHANHPCTRWAQESLANYTWLFDLGIELGREFERRFSKRHKSAILIAEALWPPPALPDVGLTEFALAMPEQYKSADAVEAYRAYYRGEKAAFATYKNCQPPSWLGAQ